MSLNCPCCDPRKNKRKFKEDHSSENEKTEGLNERKDSSIR